MLRRLVAILIMFFSQQQVLGFSKFPKNLLKLSNCLMSSSPSSSDALKKFCLSYKYVPDILEKRTPYRQGHLELWESLVKSGLLIGGGAYNPPTGALFVITASNKELIEEIVKKDPYVTANLVTDYAIQEWTPILGRI